MSLTPPDPGVPSTIQTTLSGFSFNAADGSFVDLSGLKKWLMLARDGSAGLVKGDADSTTGSPTCVPVATNSTTANIVKSGTVNGDGSITLSGVTYRIQ